jgi:predicted nucleic acid-binding protein
MGVLIDADALLRWAESPGALEAWSKGREDECFLSIVTADELLRAAQQAGDRGLRNRRIAFVEAALERLPVLPVDNRTLRIHTEIRREGRLGASDGWLAATSIAHGLLLVTPRVKVFERVSGLRCAVP